MDSIRKKQLKELLDEVKVYSHSIAMASAKDDSAILVERLSLKLAAASEISQEHRILNSLYFESMRARHLRIPQAHAETFDWILEPPR
jgi:hypothetical protein